MSEHESLHVDQPRQSAVATSAPRSRLGHGGWLAATVVLVMGLVACGERPPVEPVQRGYRGTGMEQIYNPRLIAAAASANALPADTPMAPADGPKANTVFKNVQVLGDQSIAEFTRTMASMTAWVSPQQGCTYCHTANFAEDTLYTKVVARRMLQMTRHINGDWQAHVAQTGVTCYTCHRGQPVPQQVWFNAVPPERGVYAGNKAGQNLPAATSGLSSLPYDPLTPFLQQSNEIRVVGVSALPAGNHQSIKQAEWTYGLMMHMSQSLGVNCTYCHNSRSFAEWNASTPQRVVAWHGIRMARDLNTAYLEPLRSTFPATRLGPSGDTPKVNCATCHQGAFKPLYGASQLATHPELMKVSLQTTAAPGPSMAASTASGVPTGTVLTFGVGSSALGGDAQGALGPVIDALKADPGMKATISGFNSASGDAAQNEELAKQRAFAVRDALKAAGVAEDRIVLAKPQQTEANATGEDARARRVEVAVSK